VVFGGEHILRLAEPLEYRRRPPHSAQAKFSIPFTAAVAMAYGDVRLRNYTDAGLQDNKVLAMADRVWVEKDHSTAREKEAASVEIRMRDGKVYNKQVLYALGDDRRNPMSQAQIEEKFRECASFSRKPIAKTDVEHLIGLVANIENVSDIREITKLL
jgi:2-methylcitrate dehydratase PrpD